MLREDSPTESIDDEASKPMFNTDGSLFDEETGARIGKHLVTTAKNLDKMKSSNQTASIQSISAERDRLIASLLKTKESNILKR